LKTTLFDFVPMLLIYKIPKYFPKKTVP